MDGSPASLPRLGVTCRPATASDTPAMRELTRTIWDGSDYVPLVWEDWLADQEGQLVAAEAEGRLVGVGKLTRLSAFDWWLEGLRVDPALEGRGVASQIHAYILKTWLEIGAGTLRLATFSHRFPVHHLCRQDGFSLAAELNFFSAPSLAGPDPRQDGSLEPVQADEIELALDLAQNLSGLEISAGLVDLLWQWARLRRQYLADYQADNRLFWWRDRQGLLGYTEDYDEPGKDHWPVLLCLGCPVESATEYLLDYRRLAAALGFPKAVLLAPAQSALAAALATTGFQAGWEKTLYLFVKDHLTKAENSPAE